MLPKEKTKPKQSISDLTVLIYGPSKFGKSTWASQAEHTLFLATEPGLNSLEVFQVPITSWEKFLTVCKELSEEKHGFKTVVVDTVDVLFKLCSEYVCKKQSVEHPSDLGYGKGFALINNEFARVLNKLAFLPTDLLFISHSQEREFETRTGKLTKTVPTLPEKARHYLLSFVDITLYCDLVPVQNENGPTTFDRVLRTKPSPNYEAGDRTGRLPETIPFKYRAFQEAFQVQRKDAAKP